MDEQRLNQFGQRLQRLETELWELRTAFASLQSESTTPAESAPSGVSTGPAPTAPGAAASAPPKAKQRKSISAASVESFLGGNLLGKLGLLALVLATAWFIKLAFDNHWINASGRIYTGLVLSFVTCAGSFYLAKRNYRIIAPAITGAALAMMYISIFGAYYFYDLLGRTETFLFLVLITVWGSFLAVRAGSQILYLFSTGGALLAPLILSTGENSYRFLFFYLLLIWVGYLVVSYYRFWRVSAYVLLAAVHLIYAVWAAEKLSESNEWIPILFQTILLAAVLIRAIWLSARIRGHMGINDVLLLLAGLLAFLINVSISVIWFYPQLVEHWMLTFAGVLLAVYILLERYRERLFVSDKSGRYLYLFIQSILLLAWLPLAIGAAAYFLELNWMMYGLIALAGSCSLIGALTRMRAYVFISLPLWAIGLMFSLFFPDPRPPLTLLLNERFALYLIAAVFAMGTYVVQRRKPLHAFMQAYAYLAIWFLVFGSLRETADLVQDDHYRNLAYSYVIAGYAILFLIIGFVRRSLAIRMSGIVLSCIVVLKLYIYDVWTLDLIVRIIAFFSLGVALVLLSVFYQRFKSLLSDAGEPHAKPTHGNKTGILLIAVLTGLVGMLIPSNLRAEDFRVGAYHYYNDIQIPDTYASRRATYARLPLSSDYHKYAGARDIRIVAGADIVLPHFIRRVPAAQISGGSEQPDVIFSRQERGKRVYVLRLPDPPEGKFYDMLEVSSDRDFEATVQVSTGSEADALRSQGYYSIYRYDQGGDENRLISFYRGDRDLTNRYIRLESDSDAPLYFRAAYISGEYDRAEFKIDFDVDALDSYDDGDRDAMVYYLKNERRHNLKRLELVFADKRFNRRVEIEVYDEEDKYYRFLMSGRVVSEGEADTTQILELPSAQPRELKIIIEHGDDEPLELKSMAGYVPAEEVVIDLSRIDFILEAGEKPNQFRMYYGNDYAEWPDYDLDVTYDSAQPHITVRSLEHQENPEFAYSIVEPPLSIWIIRALFLIGLAALSIPGVRIFTRFAQERQQEQSESQSARPDS